MYFWTEIKPENFKSNSMSRLLHDLRNNRHIKSCFAFGEYHHITFKNNSEGESDLLIQELHLQNHKETIMKHINPTIEDCFINLMN